MAQFEGIEFEVRGNADKATKSLLGFINVLRQAHNESKKGFGKLADDLKKAEASANSTAQSFSNLGSKLNKSANFLSFSRKLRSIDREIAQVTKRIADMQKELSNAKSPPSDDRAKTLVGDISAYRKMQEGLIKQRAEMVSNMPSELALQSGHPALAMLVKGLTSVWNLTKKVAKGLAELGKKIVVKIESATVGKLQERLKSVQKIFRALGRIAFYRAIRSAIKAVTQAFQEGLKNAYHFSAGLSNALDGRIATALDNVSSASLKMKNQLGAAFGSLLTALAPIINALIGMITALANALTQLFAAFTGGTFLKAKDTTAQFADDMKKGGGAAKEWKNQILGFDEINRLEEQGGGGGGGGGSALNPADMYEVQEIESAFKKFVDDVKSAIKRGDWKGAGDLLGEKFNELVAKIPWRELGQKFGYGINGIIQTAYYALKKANFYTLGWSMAQFLNSAIKEIDFEILGRSLILKITKALDWIMGFLGGLQWDEIGKAVGDFLRGALSEATEWIQSKDWKQIAEKVKEKITEFIQGLQTDETTESLKTFLSTAFSAAFEFVDGLFPEGVGAAIKDAVVGIISKGIGMLKSDDFKAAKNVLKYTIDKALFGDFADWWWSQGDYVGKDFIMGLITGQKSEAGTYQSELKTGVQDPTVNAFTDMQMAVDATTGEMYRIVDGKYVAMTGVVGDNVSSINGYNLDMENGFTSVGSAANGMADDAGSAMSRLNGSVAEGATATGSWFDWLASKASSLFSLLGSVNFGGFGFGGGGGSFAGGFASGGFVQSGQLFVARENGIPEYVGSFGGQTAVANNQQIVEGIKEGVMEAMSVVMGGNGQSNQPIVINLDGREIARTTTKYQNQMARAGAY